ncbi:glycosyltransferase [Pseudoxanthomonas sp. LjRoot143]|uniref:glycosyltransferase n=1 Tax=Pseudoxanthomonas sp. LjRoot143 TaxID=3342266 RepID=UPI003ECEB56D
MSLEKNLIKRTVLVLASTYPRWVGDPEPGFVHELAKRLTDRFRVVALVPHALGAPTREVMDGVEVYRYRYAPERWETLVNGGGIVANLKRGRWRYFLLPGFLLAQTWHAWRLLRRERVDVVHAHWLVPQGLIAALLRNMPGCHAPFVATSHGADLFALKGRLLGAMKRWVIRRARVVTVVSEAMRTEVRGLVGDIANPSVQPMGVDLQHRFVPIPSDPRTEDELLFVGRLVEKKGLRHLLDALPEVAAQRPNVRLRIAGFGPEEAALRQQVVALGLDKRVVFLGAVPQTELPMLYRRASLFVAPFVEAASGDQEGLGLVLVEAIGCGCPVIAGDVGAVEDVLGKESFQVVRAEDVEQLSSRIIASLSDPATAVLRAARLRERVIDRFEWTRVAKRYGDLLDEGLE